MLRALVLALLLANAGFWVWRHGWLAPLNDVIGARPEGEREPERLERQVHPERVRLIPSEAPAVKLPKPAPAERVETPAPALTACLEAGPYGTADVNAAEATLKAVLPAGAWSLRELPPAWWVAMGPYGEAEPLQKKRDELRRRSITYEAVVPGPGNATLLVLSRHDSRAQAETELAALGERGVRTARVIAASPQRALRVAEAPPEQQTLLTALPADKLRGKAFGPCPSGPP